MNSLDSIPEYKSHHQFTDPGQDYVKFEAKCQTCGMLLFEFAHKQQYLNSQDRLMAIPASNPPMAAASWYKPFVRVVCRNGNHEILPVFPGEDRNQIVTSSPMTHAEWREWMKQ